MHDSKSQLTTPLDINYLQNVLENEQTRTEVTWWESNVQLKAADSDPALWQWQPRSHFQWFPPSQQSSRHTAQWPHITIAPGSILSSRQTNIHFTLSLKFHFNIVMKYIPRCLQALTPGTTGRDIWFIEIYCPKSTKDVFIYFGPAQSSNQRFAALAAHSQNGRDETEDIISSRDMKAYDHDDLQTCASD